MTIEGRYLDEILRKLYGELSKSTDTFEASKGKDQVFLGQKVVLKDPRARISATATRGMLISALAEFCWYMSGSAESQFYPVLFKRLPSKGCDWLSSRSLWPTPERYRRVRLQH